MIDFIKEWTSKTGIRQERILKWVGLHKPKYYTWQKKYGKANEHNASIPRDHWLDDQEKQTIIDFHGKNPLNGYRRLCYMMIDQNVIAVSPTTVRNVLKSSGLMDRAKPGNSLKGTGFKQPSGPHKHWHTDITYINLGGTFYYLSAILDGYSRYIVHICLHVLSVSYCRSLPGFPAECSYNVRCKWYRKNASFQQELPLWPY